MHQNKTEMNIEHGVKQHRSGISMLVGLPRVTLLSISTQQESFPVK